MTHEQILTKAVEKAIANGWRWGLLEPMDPGTWEVTAPFGGNLVFIKTTNWSGDTNNLHPNEIIFNHDFAKALFKDAVVPDSEELDYGEREKLGLYSAKGGGYEGYGDYVVLDFDGEPWQYHLQQMVIADDPIAYLGKCL